MALCFSSLVTGPTKALSTAATAVFKLTLKFTATYAQYTMGMMDSVRYMVDKDTKSSILLLHACIRSETSLKPELIHVTIQQYIPAYANRTLN